MEGVAEVCRWAHQQGLATHLDGARLWNACVATDTTPADWVRHFDTVSVCFSKGLGAPVGSALCGPANLIRQARRLRKALGGGMRQAGFLAAAALYAVEHHYDRLVDDHNNAHVLADGVCHSPSLLLLDNHCDTNIVTFDLEEQAGTAAEFCDQLKQEGVLMMAIGKQRVRAVTHLDVTRQQAEKAADILACV